MDARELAKAAGAARRATDPVNALPRAVAGLPLNIRRQANAVVEELDLLRFFLQDATLERAVRGAEPHPRVVRVPARRFVAKAKRARKS